MTLVNDETGEVVVLMDRAAAEKITRDIKSWAGTLWLKIEEAHRGQAWRALGYASWAAYLDAEFDIGKSRGYQLVNHARAVRALAEAAGYDPESTRVDFHEKMTRDLDVDAVAAEVAEQVTDDMPEAERVDLVKRTVTEHYEASKPAPQAARRTALAAIARDPEATNEEIAARTGVPLISVVKARAEIDQTAGAGLGPTPSPAEAGEAGVGAPPPASSAPPAEDEDPQGDMPPTGSETESAGGSSHLSPADPYPELTYAVNAKKAAARIYEDCAVLDAARLPAEDRDDWLALADHLTAKADEIRSAFTRPHLEAVR